MMIVALFFKISASNRLTKKAGNMVTYRVGIKFFSN